MSELDGDHLLRALLPRHNVRVVAAVTGDVAREAARRHGAVGGVAAALGRAATAGLLLATITKDRERLTAELAGDGPLGSLMVDAAADGAVRVYVKNPAITIPALPQAHVPLGRAIGTEGHVRVARDLGLREIVSGQTSLVDGEMDTRHRALPGRQRADPQRARLRDVPGHRPGPHRQRRHPAADAAGQRGPALAGRDAEPNCATVPWGGRWPPSARAAAPRRWPARCWAPEAHDLLSLDTRPLRFHCACSKERAASALALLGAAQLQLMADEDDGAEVTCDFCRARHHFTRADLDHLRAEPPAAPDRARRAGRLKSAGPSPRTLSRFAGEGEQSRSMTAVSRPESSPHCLPSPALSGRG